MKTKQHDNGLDADLMLVFKETFGDDQRLLDEVVAEAKRALRIVREELDWNEQEYPDYNEAA